MSLCMSDRWSLIIFLPQPATAVCAAVMPVGEPEKHRLLAGAGILCSISDEASAVRWKVYESVF